MLAIRDLFKDRQASCEEQSSGSVYGTISSRATELLYQYHPQPLVFIYKDSIISHKS